MKQTGQKYTFTKDDSFSVVFQKIHQFQHPLHELCHKQKQGLKRWILSTNFSIPLKNTGASIRRTSMDLVE